MGEGVLKTGKKLRRLLWTASKSKCPVRPNLPKSRTFIMKKSPPQDFIMRTHFSSKRRFQWFSFISSNNKIFIFAQLTSPFLFAQIPCRCNRQIIHILLIWSQFILWKVPSRKKWKISFGNFQLLGRNF